MIDLAQWRASIGLWNYCQAASSRPANGRQCHSFKGAVDSKSDSITSVEKTTKLPAAIPVAALLLLLCICFPLIRIDYTPPTGKPLLVYIIQYILLLDIITHCYWSQVQCNTDIYSLQSVVLPGATINLIILSIVRLLLLLSGDVELNPGPTVDDRPKISLLIEWLDPLVDWQSFGYCLPEIDEHDIPKIETGSSNLNEQKRKLYSIWLSVCPEGTWNDVIKALETNRQNALAHDIKEKIKSSSNDSSTDATPAGKVEVMFKTNEEEEEVSQKLIELNKKFSSLDTEVQIACDQKVAANPILLKKLKIWTKSYMTWKDKMVTAASLEEFFTTIDPYYDFIDCSLIVDMSEEFLEGETFGKKKLNIVSELKKHKEEAKKIYSLTTVKHLNTALKNIYKDHIPDFRNMPHIILKLHNTWFETQIETLKLLIHHLLPEKLKQSLMKYITITKGCIAITYAILDITADSLIEYAGGKLQFMRLIGILSLHINDHAVLQEDENMNFTFELALLEAVTAGHNEAVEFLHQIETVNINHTNEEGKTALMLACERGHEDIVHSLLSAGANVNLQDNNGWTAVMRVIRHNHISIINMLLQANTWLKLPNGPTEILMKACKSGNTQRVKLLLKDKVDPNTINKEGKTALMLACEKGHEDIIHSLLSAGANVNLQDNNGWTALMRAIRHDHISIINMLLQANAWLKLPNGPTEILMKACKSGDTQRVKLLLKDKVDPNATNEEGKTALMLAGERGHEDIVHSLLSAGANVNLQDNNGWTALMRAIRHDHISIINMLLQANAWLKLPNGPTEILMKACKSGDKELSCC